MILTKLVKFVWGKGLCKLVAKGKEENNEHWDEKDEKYIDWHHLSKLGAYNSEKYGSLDEFGWENEAQMSER